MLYSSKPLKMTDTSVKIHMVASYRKSVHQLAGDFGGFVGTTLIETRSC